MYAFTEKFCRTDKTHFCCFVPKNEGHFGEFTMLYQKEKCFIINVLKKYYKNVTIILKKCENSEHGTISDIDVHAVDCPIIMSLE